MKLNKKEEKCYAVIDKITEDVLCIIKAKNQKDCVRNMVFSGFFKVNRLNDTKVYECYMPKYEREVNLTETMKELSIEIEDKAKKIDGDAKKKIIEETKGGKNGK